MIFCLKIWLIVYLLFFLLVSSVEIVCNVVLMWRVNLNTYMLVYKLYTEQTTDYPLSSANSVRKFSCHIGFWNVNVLVQVTIRTLICWHCFKAFCQPVFLIHINPFFIRKESSAYYPHSILNQPFFYPKAKIKFFIHPTQISI